MNFIAYAQSAEGASGAGFASLLQGPLLPMFAIMVIFYFLMIRPQQKKEKERKNMLNAIVKGDKVVTVGGIIGIVQQIKAEEDIVTLNIGGSTKVDFTRSAIQNKVLPKNAQPQPKDDKKGKTEKQAD